MQFSSEYTSGDGKDVIYGFEDGDLLQITGDSYQISGTTLVKK